MRFLRPACALLLLGWMFSPQACASNQTVVATISFDTASVINKNADISFGSVKAGQAGFYVISPAGIVTSSNGGVWTGGTVQGGNLTITGSATHQINIAVGNYVADKGVTPSAATCAYDGGAAVPCGMFSQAPPAAGKILQIGISLAVDGSQSAGTTAAPSFDVIITNQ